jgi:hypothetical protein
MGLLGLVCAAALAGFVVMLTRFPQDEGDPIKSSYLLFTAPCWALLSVAAWLEVRKRSRTIHLLLVAAAVLYAISYAAHLVGVFT